MEKQIEFIFNNTNNWLKFAEAKNAALLTFNAGLFIALIKSFDISKICWQWLTYYYYGALFLLAISALICLLSFAPRLRVSWLFNKSKDNPAFDVIFFGEVAYFTPKEYLKKLSEKTGDSIPDCPGYLEDLANQIIVNSGIALSKYKMFNAAMWLTVCSIFSPIGLFFVYIFGLKAA